MADDPAASLEDTRAQMTELTALARGFERAISAAFKSGATQAKGFETVLRSVALQMSGMMLKGALKPLSGGLGGASNSLFANLFGANEAPSAASEVAGFAQGGVFASPRYFPVDQGLGMLGEAGPEAIMPLTRDADGRLGVVASGGQQPSIVVHIATPDAPSFLRSETQISAALARAVARGRRGL